LMLDDRDPNDGYVLPNYAAARAQLDDSTYRHTYNKHDFVVLAPQQRAIVNCPARHKYVKAGNRTGKTFTSAYEMTCHALGRYPSWWTGRRYPQGGPDRHLWIVSPSNQQSRDVATEVMFGSVLKGTVGQGMVPAESIVTVYPARGPPGSVDTVVLKRGDGGLTTVAMRSMEVDPQNLQGTNLEGCWVDEICSSDALWNELLARMANCDHAVLLMSATPTRQQASSSRWFSEPGHPDRAVLRMSAYETTHLSEETLRTMEGSFSTAERKTRLFGDDFAAGGMVLSIDRVKMTSDKYFAPGLPVPLILGIDPSHGGQSSGAHPSGVCLCAYVRSEDVFYVIDSIREQHISPSDLVARIRQRGWINVPCAWGHGELQGIANTDETFATLFKSLGLRMLPTHSAMNGGYGGGVSLDPQWQAIQMGLDNGSIKINHACHELLEELEGLERDERGRCIPVRDDLVSAFRYAWMMRKSAREVEDETYNPYANERIYPKYAQGTAGRGDEYHPHDIARYND
jgi:hypothetical protein